MAGATSRRVSAATRGAATGSRDDERSRGTAAREGGRMEDEREPSRRFLLAAAGLGLSAAMAPEFATAAGAESETIWSHEYTARKGKVSLAMFRKRGTAPGPGGEPLPGVCLG